MKLRGWDRIVLFVGAFLIAAIGVSIFLISLSIGQIAFPVFGGEEFVVSKLIILLCGVFLFIYAIYLFGMSLNSHGKKAEFVVQETSGGELRISINALDSLVRKVMATHTEMSLKDMSVENIKDNVSVDIKIAIAGNVSIPLAVAAVQKEIRQHLLSSTGIDIKEVKVSVDTADAAVEASPFIMHETVPTISTAEDQTQEIKKKHRLFSKKADAADAMKGSLLSDNYPDQQNISEETGLNNVSAQQQGEGTDKHAGA